MGRLGVAEEYEVQIVESKDTTNVLAIMPYSKLKWSRIRNGVSNGYATIPGADGGMERCGFFGGLRPWDHALYITRDGDHVWSGPITSWSRPGSSGDLEITASDVSILFAKRLVGVTKIYATKDADGNVTVPGVLVNLLDDLFDYSLLGTAYDPFPMFRPTFIPDTYSAVPIGGSAFSIPVYNVPTGRELQVTRLEKVADVLNEFIRDGLFFYTTIGSFLFVNEYAVRAGLGGIDGISHPTLSESTVQGLPTVNVDAIDMATRGFVGGSNAGATGHPVIAKFEAYDTSAWSFIDGSPPPYLASVLESGRASTNSSTLVTAQDFTAEAAAYVASVASPNLTIEQVVLSPDFSHPYLADDLSNLLPGVRFIVNFDETCAFNLPVSETKQVILPGAVNPSSASLWSGLIQHVRLEQLEVEVTVSSDGVQEKVMASLMPTVQWVVQGAYGRVVN